MVLLPAGLVLGKAILNAVQNRGTQNAAVKVAARTSAMMGGEGRIERGRGMERRAEGLGGGEGLRKRINPYTNQEIRNRMGGTSVRMMHKQAQRDAIDLKEALENEKWVPVYRFEGIRFGVLLARAKLVQTIASVLYLPYSAFGLLTGTNDQQTFMCTLVLAVAAPLLLAVFSRYLNRLIGVISMNESNEYARIGYLTFWGSRKNQLVEVADIISITENSSEKDQVVKLQWYAAGSNYLFLSTRNCEIVDEKRAEILFGDLNLFQIYKTN
ncbi:hypothetical protein PFISCL1PPCAC_1947 [Pristionchus fissidentatus]|uniref:Transmembrane protein 186 n=1 Tax=Pristionchus fissidentatus TaxID=1538716 RepID=A0AAV5UYP6_9BILA|nr:hypothetical protein PFISCL1PPCAC_1947 [Pristionchus fissidentatus]